MRDEDFREHTQGEFRGDFTRDTFYPLRHFTRVLLQQGRVELDANWNEQVSILLRYLRSLARDVGSEHWGPTTGAGFEITSAGPKEFKISAGHYYVQGLLCENEEKDLSYTITQVEGPDNHNYCLVYLDVWERHLTYIEDDLIREVALGGPDTATRAKIVWQVKVRPLEVNGDNVTDLIKNLKSKYQTFLGEIEAVIKPGSGKLRARARKQKDADEPCLTTPEARYRGAENQLYRVEIHKDGVAWNGRKKDEGGNQDDAATFKWSRDNGSVIFPIRQLAGTEVVVEHLGRDERSSLHQGDWVEVVDDDQALRGETGPLAQVIFVDRVEMRVTLSKSPGRTYDQTTVHKHPLLRRWDQKSDAIPVHEGDREQSWIDLEDGVQIQFLAPPAGQTVEYRVGDYWLIPARVATGDVEWPGPMDNPTALPPHGVAHYYAPLAMIPVDNVGNVTGTLTDLRRKLKQLWS
ncbi:MAG TPA: DUF6519 domain-containing protein [Patescibacteria group bacterium]|nr:DUF6519 domain-containing protein [Patescibacteria group bacterium]